MLSTDGEGGTTSCPPALTATPYADERVGSAELAPGAATSSAEPAMTATTVAVIEVRRMGMCLSLVSAVVDDDERPEGNLGESSNASAGTRMQP